MAPKSPHDDPSDLKRRLEESQQRLQESESARTQLENVHQRTLKALKLSETKRKQEDDKHEHTHNARVGLDVENRFLTKRLAKFEWLTTAYSEDELQARYTAETKFQERERTIEEDASKSTGSSGVSSFLADFDETSSESTEDSLLVPTDEPQLKRIKRAAPVSTSFIDALFPTNSAPPASASNNDSSTVATTRAVPCTKCFVHGWKCDQNQPCRNCVVTGKDSKCKRTKCKFYQTGTCPDGETCGYAHKDDGYEHLVQYRKMRRDGLGLAEPVEEEMRRKKDI